ncbi:MAG: argininosuccinate lyase [Nitrospinota bacterium]|nr:argininosuccinate lyase [Nitrospinota bacterium]
MNDKKKAWGGRFTIGQDPAVERFNASIGFDRVLYKQDLALSRAHAAMLGRQKIIPKKDADKIIKGLTAIEKEMDAGKFLYDQADEDIHMAIERRLGQIIGPDIGGKLHTARSRNDQVATSFRMWTRGRTDDIIRLIRRLQRALAERAAEHTETIAPAYTHLQQAQPVPLAHWFLAYFEMFGRDAERLIDARKRINVMPLGSAALAGTNFPIDRAWVAKELGFDAVSENSMDAVSDRDFAGEFLFCVAMMATHLSRLSEELIIYSSAEFGVMDLPDDMCTGSSIMPQKKNPDVPELIRGKTGRLYGHLISVLTMLKGLPLAYNKDMQEDKEPLFDAAEQMEAMLELAAMMVARLDVDKEKLATRAAGGYMTAVDVADRLVMTGAPFRDAHQIVGKLVRHCLDRGIGFDGLAPEDAASLDPLLPKAMKGAVSAIESARAKNVKGGAAPARIRARLKQIGKEMTKWEK